MAAHDNFATSGPCGGARLAYDVRTKLTTFMPGRLSIVAPRHLPLRKATISPNTFQSFRALANSALAKDCVSSDGILLKNVQNEEIR